MKLCVPIQASTQKEVKRRLLEASKQADLAEIWLDRVKDLDLPNLLAKAPLPILCVCKKVDEKGGFTGTREAQAQVLLDAIKYGAKYVDIPLNMPDKLNKKIVQNARKKGVKVIISHHDFKSTPELSKMLKITQKMTQKGANVVKLAVTSKSLQDAIDIICLGKYLQEQKMPHILIGMGQKGRLTRILTPTLGGEMMFATLSKKGQTATGQFTVKQLKKAWSLIKTK